MTPGHAIVSTGRFRMPAHVTLRDAISTVSVTVCTSLDQWRPGDG
jgi:hypothetical protein